MFDFGCHRLELLVDLFGPVVDVTSALGNVAFARDVEDTAIAILTFERGGYGTLSVTHAAREAQDTLHVFGSTGSIHVAALNHGEVRVSGGAVDRIEVLPPHANLHLPLIADFADAVIAGRAPRVSGETGRMVADLEARIYDVERRITA